MNTIQCNGAHVTARARTPQHISRSSPISRSQFELEAKPAPAAVPAPPVLITEKQVVFSTAAAMSVRPTTMHRWARAIGVVLAVMHRIWLTSKADDFRPRQDYPQRYAFLENACMAREMDRL